MRSEIETLLVGSLCVAMKGMTSFQRIAINARAEELGSALPKLTEDVQGKAPYSARGIWSPFTGPRSFMFTVQQASECPRDHSPAKTWHHR